MSKRPATLIEPRGLTREEAAAYCGLTPDGFDHWRRKGQIPGPIPGTRRWDKRKIDVALDLWSNVSTTSPSVSALDEWRRSREAKED